MKKRYTAEVTISFDVSFDPFETSPEEVEVDIASTAGSTLSVYEGVYHRVGRATHADVKLTERRKRR